MTSVVNQLSADRLFVVAKLEPKADGSGTDKIPVDPATGLPVDAQNPAAWMTGAEAEDAAAVLNLARPAGVTEYGVGLVLQSGLWCVDLDHCRDGEGWQPHVSNVLARFPGAYVEVSASLTGLHIIGRATEFPLHGTRCAALRAEAYSARRFIYLTGYGARGDARTDLTDAFRSFATQYFPMRDHGSAEWSEGPCAAWRGPTDDDVLLAKALRSRSGRALMGHGVAFTDLWNADADKLARFFPPQGSGTWDGSAADQALANQLAFWTGNDCERMQRLMRASGLRRDKYDRPDYLPRTIIRACGDQTEWYHDGGAAQPPETPTEAVPACAAPAPTQSPVLTVEFVDGSAPAPVWQPPTPRAAGALPAPGQYLTLDMQQDVFSEMCWVSDINRIQLPDGIGVPKDRFDIRYAGRLWATSLDGQRPTRSAWDAFTMSEIHDFPKVHTQFFKPGVPCGTIRIHEGQRQINCYQPAVIPRQAGDPEPFLGFLRTLVPDEGDRTILLSWAASLVRNLGVKFKWAPFIQGVKGNGKTTLGRILEQCISERYTHWAKPSELHEKFNQVFVDKLLVIVDETRTQDQTELQEALKLFVTSTRMEVRPMYAEKTMKDVCFNMALFSNHKNGVRIDKDERRFAPFYCAQQKKAHNARDGLTVEFFVNFNRWLDGGGFAIIFDYLMSYAITPEYDPAGACVVAPITSSTVEAITASLGGIEQEIFRAIEQRVDGFRNGWISSSAVDMLLARLGKDRHIPQNARRDVIMGCGYEPHPALPEGLCDAGWTDGTVPRIYIQPSHPWALPHLTATQVRDGFLAHQKR